MNRMVVAHTALIFGKRMDGLAENVTILVVVVALFVKRMIDKFSEMKHLFNFLYFHHTSNICYIE